MSERTTTTELPAVTDRVLLEELMRESRAARAASEAGFEQMSTNFETLHYDVGQVKERLGSLEMWRVNQEGRAKRNSDRAQDLSDHDMGQDAAIAQLLVKATENEQRAADVEALAKSSAVSTKKIEKAVTGFLSHPRVQAVGWAVSAALLAWLAKTYESDKHQPKLTPEDVRLIVEEARK